MTDNKRFVYYEHKGADYILENPNTELDFIEMLGDCLEAEEIVDKLNELYDENNKWIVEYNGLNTEYECLKEENEQLKQRNKRQYNQLNELWNLIENKDWETLTEMIKQMKEDEEQLQSEWRSIND